MVEWDRSPERRGFRGRQQNCWQQSCWGRDGAMSAPSPPGNSRCRTPRIGGKFVNVHLDLDNSSRFTPFVGVGGGASTVVLASEGWPWSPTSDSASRFAGAMHVTAMSESPDIGTCCEAMRRCSRTVVRRQPSIWCSVTSRTIRSPSRSCTASSDRPASRPGASRSSAGSAHRHPRR